MNRCLIEVQDRVVGFAMGKEQVVQEGSHLVWLSALEGSGLDVKCICLENLLLVYSDVKGISGDLGKYTEVIGKCMDELVNSRVAKYIRVGFRMALVLKECGICWSLSLRYEELVYCLANDWVKGLAAECIFMVNDLGRVDQIVWMVEGCIRTADWVYAPLSIVPFLKALCFLITQSVGNAGMFECLFEFTRSPYKQIKYYSSLAISKLYLLALIPQQEYYKLHWVLLQLTEFIEDTEYTSKVLKLISIFTLGNELIQKNCLRTKLIYDVIHKAISSRNRLGSDFFEQQMNYAWDSPDLPQNTDKLALKTLINSLECVSSMSETLETNREIIHESTELMKIMICCLRTSIYRVRLAACKCAFHLSRASKRIKNLIFGQHIGKLFLMLLNDPVPKIQEISTATLANLLLDITADKFPEISSRLIHMLDSEYPKIKSNALFTLKNLIFKSPENVKNTIISKLTYHKLFELTEDEDIRIREQAMIIIRNILLPDAIQVDEVLSNASDLIFRLIEKYLHSTHTQILINTLYIATCIANGNETHKDLIYLSPFFNVILQLTDHSDGEVRNGVACILINLCGATGGNSSERYRALLALGVLPRLTKLKEESSTGIKIHLEDAISRLRSIE